MEKTPKSQTRVFFLAENGLSVRQRHLRWSKALTLDHLEVGVTANGVLFLLLQFFGHVIGRWYWVQQTQMLLLGWYHQGDGSFGTSQSASTASRSAPELGQSRPLGRPTRIAHVREWLRVHKPRRVTSTASCMASRCVNMCVYGLQADLP